MGDGSRIVDGVRYLLGGLHRVLIYFKYKNMTQLPAHLQKLVDDPKFQKRFKKEQYKIGVKMFGKKRTAEAMKEKYKA